MQWLTRGALLLAWISWAWVTLCVTLELRSWVTGHTPARLPASRTMQSAVACLVGTALAVSLMGRGLSAGSTSPPDQAITSLGQLPVLEDPIRLGARSPAPGPPMTAAVGTIRLYSDDDEESLGHSASLPPDRALWPSGSAIGEDLGRVAHDRRSYERRESAAAMPTGSDPFLYRVAPRDTLWSIADKQLGSARRWKELAQLNYGGAQPDGGSLGHDHWVRPGWTLRLPSVDGPADGVSPEVRTPDGPRHGRDRSAGYVHRTIALSWRYRVSCRYRLSRRAVKCSTRPRLEMRSPLRMRPRLLMHRPYRDSPLCRLESAWWARGWPTFSTG